MAKESSSSIGWAGLGLRLAFLGVLAATVAAILVGDRFGGTGEAAIAGVAGPIPVPLNGSFSNGTDGTKFLDSETGREIKLALPRGGKLDRASCSPWHDARGGYQIVGTWEKFDDQYGTKALIGVDLVRIHQPDGAVMGRVEMPSILTSTPAWAPGSAARIYFTAMDTRLYTYDFEPNSGERPLAAPLRVRWDVPQLDASRLIIRDVYCPRETGLENTLLLGVARQPREPGERAIPTIWWARLDPSGMAVVAAGPVFTDAVEPGSADLATARQPVSFERDGSLYMAYLRPEGKGDWSPVVVPLEIHPETGAPGALAATATALSRRACLPIAPVVVDQGRRLLVFGRDATIAAVARPVALDTISGLETIAGRTGLAREGISRDDLVETASPSAEFSDPSARHGLY